MVFTQVVNEVDSSASETVITFPPMAALLTANALWWPKKLSQSEWRTAEI